MRFSLIWIFNLLLVSQLTFAQLETQEIPFNQQKEHRVGVGFAITGFTGSFTYLLSPSYTFRSRRHSFGLAPFYGRLDALADQHDVGVGIDYRLFPFRNLNSTLLYFPVSAHYNYKWTDRSIGHGMLYRVGFGTEVQLGKWFALAVDACFGVGQTIRSHVSANEVGQFGSGDRLQYHFFPSFRLYYRL